jgi:large subunit ribosomal protein L29
LKAKDFAEMSDEELQGKYLDLKAELFNLRFQNATGQLDNPMRLREVRRDIARVKTVQRMRELASVPTAGPEPRQAVAVGSSGGAQTRRGRKRGAAQ